MRKDIRDFRDKNGLDKVIVLWTANTERFAALETGLNDTKESLLASIARGEEEVRRDRPFVDCSVQCWCRFVLVAPLADTSMTSFSWLCPREADRFYIELVSGKPQGGVHAFPYPAVAGTGTGHQADCTAT